MKTAGIALLAAAVIAGGGYTIHQRTKPPPPQPPPDPSVVVSPNVEPSTNVVQVERPPEELDAGVVALAPPDAGQRPNQGSNVPVTPPDAGAQVVAVPPVEVPVKVTIASGSEWRLPGGKWQPITGNEFKVLVDQPTKIEVRNDCCQAESVTLDRTTRGAIARLQFLSAQLRPVCKDSTSVVVSVEWTTGGKAEKRTPPLGSDVAIPFERDATSSTRSVTVTFTNGDQTDRKDVTVSAGKSIEVPCSLE
jgi:hypothetical protein